MLYMLGANRIVYQNEIEGNVSLWKLNDIQL